MVAGSLPCLGHRHRGQVLSSLCRTKQGKFEQPLLEFQTKNKCCTVKTLGSGNTCLLSCYEPPTLKGEGASPSSHQPPRAQPEQGDPGEAAPRPTPGWTGSTLKSWDQPTDGQHAKNRTPVSPRPVGHQAPPVAPPPPHPGDGPSQEARAQGPVRAAPVHRDGRLPIRDITVGTRQPPGHVTHATLPGTTLLQGC